MATARAGLISGVKIATVGRGRTRLRPSPELGHLRQ
jgi:hypothetical protein